MKEADLSDGEKDVAHDLGEDQQAGNDLLATIGEMSQSLETMKDIIQKANFIALNASIEAARTQSQSENFTLVADQVRRQADRTEELASSLGTEVSDLEGYALRALAVNFTDIANDIIDKIDRNLFERNCDMQAWSGFKENVECAIKTKNLSAEEVTAALKAWEGGENNDLIQSIEASCHRLNVLCETYQVYCDVFLMNNKGIVVATARSKDLIGLDLSQADYFKHVSGKNDVFVTDMFRDPSIKANTVSYNAPVLEDDLPIGVISTRFNWACVEEMVETMPLVDTSKMFIISKDGTVLASRNKAGVLKDNLSWLAAGEQAIAHKSGYTIECERNGRLGAWGFCHTFGYNAYKGKEWSAIVTNPIDLRNNRFISEFVSREGEEKKQAADNANDNLERVAEAIKTKVASINDINNETNMLAVNAAIQAGVAGHEGEAFSVIASEIGQLARQSEAFVNNINELTKRLGVCVRNTVFTRLGEAAFDTIDKIDRNLFERNCDVQAFASFDEIQTFNSSNDNKEVLEILRRLHQIYEVYHDIFLLDSDGNIVGAAMHRELIGHNQSDRSWFRDCVSGNLVVTDLYYSKSINDYTMTYAAPVTNSQGKVVGVLTTRFNCDYIYDIMKATLVGEGSYVYLINSKGTVIGSPDGEGILKDSFDHLKAYKALNKHQHGYILEDDAKYDSRAVAIGYAKTQGYLNYRGKGWSIMIKKFLEQTTEESKKEQANNQPAA